MSLTVISELPTKYNALFWVWMTDKQVSALKAMTVLNAANKFKPTYKIFLRWFWKKKMVVLSAEIEKWENANVDEIVVKI